MKAVEEAHEVDKERDFSIITQAQETMDAARALQKKLLSKVNATAGMVEEEYREGFKSLMSRRMRLNKDTLVHIGEHAKEQLRLARAKDEAAASDRRTTCSAVVARIVHKR